MKIEGELKSITQTIPLRISSRGIFSPLAMDCFADRCVFCGFGKRTTDAEAAAFVRRLTDAGIIELLRGYVAAIERSNR